MFLINAIIKMAAYMTPRIASKPFIIGHINTTLKRKSSLLCRCLSTETNKVLQDEKEKEEFRVYEIEGLVPKENVRTRRKNQKRIPPPRFKSMPTDQSWTDVWPTAQTFNWSIVPFPVRQGFIESSIENEGVVPGKYANMELMKIPNFLHLTPAHIKKHCDALKQFCTPWPDGLETDEQCRHHFPMEHVTSDYITSGPTSRDSRARMVTVKFHLSDLDLDYHARDKFIRLVGERYNPDTDEVVLQSDRCPLKSQNLDFLNFVLTAVYFESWKTEGWEALKQLSDMEKYFWDINKSRKGIVSILNAIKETELSGSKGPRLGYLPEDLSDEDGVVSLTQVQQYKESITDVFNEGETTDTLNKYKDGVKNVLNLKSGL